MKKKTMRRWLNRLLFLAIIAAGIGVYILYINSAKMYDFEQLTGRMDFGESRPFEPLTDVGEGRVPDMVLAHENEYIALYVNMDDTTFAVYDKRNGMVWHSFPQGPETVANPFNREIMRSNMGFSYFDASRRRQHKWLYTDSVAFGPEQFTISSISHGRENGLRIEYVVGDMDIGLHAIPRYISHELFHMIHDYLEETSPRDASFFRQQWRENEELHPGFRWLHDGIWDHVINTNRMLSIFYDLFDWSLEKTIEHNELSGYEPDINFDYFYVTFEIMMDRDRIIVNVPVDGIEMQSDEYEASLFSVDILRFFGAGDAYTDGFMLVPSGAGGVIHFNNGKYREMPFQAKVYGTDMLHTSFFPQVEQPVRLPVIGIQNNGAGMIAHIHSGAALGTINAMVGALTPGMGVPTSHNNAWFNFTLRESMAMTIDSVPGASGDLVIIQEGAWPGDITIIYQFLPQENAGVGEMAQAYQQYLVEHGVLTPLDGPGDRTFYLDILGAIDVRRHILGTPYTAMEIMTDMEDAHRFVDILNLGGVNKIQMQLHGWFNRGINHDVARNVNVIRDVGTRRELQEMEARLQATGGGLNPAVNFQLTNWFSRNFNRTLEVSRDPAGYLGFMSRVSRDMLFTRFSQHMNDWFVLVHPATMPYHMDDFIPNFQRRAGLSGLALADLGDLLTESAYRRNPINREHARLIAVDQMGRLNDAVSNLVVFGGNDYALAFASHIVDAPTEPDRYFIIDYDVPFYPMVLHGFVEFAGREANMRETFSPDSTLLNSMTTGASPRYVMSAKPTRYAEFSPHERFYSTHYENWMAMAIRHYTIFNEVFRDLRAERIVDFEILRSRQDDFLTGNQVTVTVFSNGTRIYVNNTSETFEHDGVLIPPEWFVVRGA